ncbi:hypothetical protein SUGI_0053100 [Cryptomeria japonica]|uniref:cysteine proteinase inhibitor 12 n=1 Tax=Cryptomeria japonica TaxID=3369 RepID=UPI002408B6B1|nr:cysteine proteinase inhibitor 12 [Cryptomeria japonica]GLJ06933.1 hypothetical protein SUGI_0053100 [Cryptomeria japonica]
MQLQGIGKAIVIAIAIAILGVGSMRATAMGTLGGKHAVQGSENSLEIEELGRFAIQHHNIQRKENEKELLSFSRVVKVDQQVVAGTVYHLTLEAKEDGDSAPKLYEAKVWVKPWENFKELQDFKPSSSSPSITTADLGVKHEGLGSGWREVPVHDPVVKEAAEHAVSNIQQRSNSLAAYMLQEILLAKAEVIDGFAKFDLLLKTKRGVKEEQHKVEMHRNLEGDWMLKSHSTDLGH